MTQTYFLGANSRKGFASLYDGFPPAPDAFLHILKSGPGTGKSSFLRRIGREAEARGLDVHYVLCSGDPDSLDGVYVPAVGQAWVDGTAPHVIEPGIFGADSNYVNLGAFFREPFDDREKARLIELSAAFKARYQAAYGLLSGLEYPEPEECSPAAGDTLRRVLNALPRRDRKASLSRRFLSAVSCQGILRLTGELSDFQLLACKASDLETASSELPRLGWDAIQCPSPLDPDRAEALLLPESRVAFTAFSQLDPERQPLLRQALDELRAAKALHDELETVYRPHMHFSALDAYTESVIGRLFEAE